MTAARNGAFDWRRVRRSVTATDTELNAPYRLHKWWARRPPSLVREMLRFAATQVGRQSGTLTGLTVLDPFVGGGSVAIEAARLGANAVACDVRPLAMRVLAQVLAGPVSDDIWARIEATLQEVEDQVERYYPRTKAWQVLHYFWVDRIRCRSCRRQFDAHPSTLLAAHDGTPRPVAVCLACSRLRITRAGAKGFRCNCGFSNRLDSKTAKGGKATCPHCGDTIPLRTGARKRHLFAAEEIGPLRRRRFRGTNVRDTRAFERARAYLQRHRRELNYPSRVIPAETGDSRPQSYGIRRFDQLFNSRQLLVHALVFKALRTLRGRARELGALVASEALATNCLMNAYATEYGRASAAFSIHGYMYVSRPVELNPWIHGSGRGTIWNCLRKARFAMSHAPTPQPGHRLFRGSAEAIPVRDIPRVDIVCTDPPYYDNVSYGRLSAFYENWIDSISAPKTIVKVRGKPLSLTGEAFSDGLAQVLSACKRRLKPNGIVLFTYAHTSDEGWMALQRALAKARLFVSAIFPAETEGMNGFHRYTGSLRWNAVVVCSRQSPRRIRRREVADALRLTTVSKADKANFARALDMAIELRGVSSSKHALG